MVHERWNTSGLKWFLLARYLLSGSNFIMGGGGGEGDLLCIHNLLVYFLLVIMPPISTFVVNTLTSK